MLFMKTVFLFPGQGAQYPGMAKDLFEASPAVRTLFEAAGAILKKDLKRLLFDGTEDELKITENTQAAVTLTNLAAAQVLRECGISPDYCAGFSVGEYAALYEAGVLELADLFKVVAIRGEVMEKASRQHDGTDGPSGMTAVLGLAFQDAAPVVEKLAAAGVFIANHSSPNQIVLAGTAAGLAKAETALTEAGAMRVVRLKVSGPFHSPLLAQAATEFANRTQDLSFHNPNKPIISNVTAKPITSGDEARSLAKQQIVSTVRWVDSMAWLAAQNIGQVLEVGPGKVLGGLWKSFTKEIKCQSAGNMADIEALFSTIIQG
jgi:[acyl-carrier-protein] S-malonyltransferase